ncbi:MAG: 9-hexadecenoic acid cis-trans isomerase, partial [Pseudomonadales bacterium]|nr:9-hexadecenoic acid cis-trans isomerase [Pseudomonadales bacterium]
MTLTSCATYERITFANKYGESTPKQREVETLSAGHIDYWQDVKPIVESRCVVCHACYDAPCQLKLSSVEGIDRGASKALVYEGTRLTAAAPTRLFEDAQTTQEWRNAG